MGVYDNAELDEDYDRAVSHLLSNLYVRLTALSAMALSFVGVGFAWSSYAFSENVMFES